MSTGLLPEPDQPGRVVDAELHLLDRQVLDVDGEPVCTVDDLELGAVGDDPDIDRPLAGDTTVVVTALLSGPVLGGVVGGRPDSSRRHRIAWRYVTDIGTAVHLGAHGEQFSATWVERWLRERVFSRIPGGRHDPEADE